MHSSKIPCFIVTRTYNCNNLQMVVLDDNPLVPYFPIFVRYLSENPIKLFSVKKKT